MSASDELTDYLVRLLNVCLRPQHLAISAEVDAELRRRVTNACMDGDPIEELLDRLPTMPRMQRASEDDLEPGFEQARRAREKGGRG